MFLAELLSSQDSRDVIKMSDLPTLVLIIKA